MVPPGSAQPSQACPGPPIHRCGRAGTRQRTQPRPPGPGAPLPHTDHHPPPRPPPSKPPRQGPKHSQRLVPPTRELNQAHRQSPRGPSHPRQRPPRGHRRPRTLANSPTGPRPARLDPPNEWGQALTHNTDTNVTRRGTTRLRQAPAEKDHPADPNHPEQWEQAAAPMRDTALRAAGLRTPDDNPLPQLQTATTPCRRSGVQSSSAGTTT